VGGQSGWTGLWTGNQASATKLIASAISGGGASQPGGRSSGHTCTVPNSRGGPASTTGVACLFHRDAGGAGNWGAVKTLGTSDAGLTREFGRAVAASAEVVAVGAPTGAGAVYLFARNLGGTDAWGQEKKVLAADGASTDLLGSRLALSGDLLVAGVPSAAAMSATSPIRPSGVAASIARRVGSCFATTSSALVSTEPTAIALTRTCGARSAAASRVQCASAAFAVP